MNHGVQRGGGGQRGKRGLGRLPPGPRGGRPTRLPRGPSSSVPLNPSGLSPDELSTAELGGGAPHYLVPLAHLADFERKTLTAASHFHGVVRNELGVFVVFNADRNALLRIPRPESRHHYRPALHATSWMSVRRVFLACGPRYPIFDGDLVGVLDISLRSLPTVKKQMETGLGWAMSWTVVERWANLEGFLNRVAVTLRWRVGQISPAPNCGTMQARPITFGYSDSFATEEELANAVARSRDAFVPLLGAIAIFFLALDGSVERASWRSTVMEALHMPHRLMDSLEAVVERLLRNPAGMILDFTLENPHELDWLFSLLVNDTVSIHLPLYFFLGQGNEAVNRATHVEAFPSMRKIHLSVQDTIRVLNELPLVEVASKEYVFVPWNMRQFGTIPNPEYYETLDSPQRQFPPVDPHSGQKPGEDYKDFFARRTVRNKRRLAAETPQQQQSRLQRERGALSHAAPGKKGARVFIWEEKEKFWICRLLQRNEVEDEWDDFAQSQRIYDSFSNEWDLCLPLDPTAVVSYSDDDDDDDDFGFGFYRNPPAAAHPTEFRQDCDPTDDFEGELPAGLSVEVQSALSNASAILGQVDMYNRGTDEEQPWKTTPVFVAEHNPTRAILEYRVGFIGDTPGTFPEMEMARLQVSAHFVGDAGSSTAMPISNSVRALLHVLNKAKCVKDMPSGLFDLSDENTANEIWSKSGVIVAVTAPMSEKAYRSTGYLLQPRTQEGAFDRQILLFSATTVLHIVRLRCSSWNELIGHLYHLGAEFIIGIEASSFLPSSYRPELFRCGSLGVRPEGYVPSRGDLSKYWELLSRFLHSPRGRLALQAGGIVARLARLIIDDPELDLRTEFVDVEIAEECLKFNDTSFYYHALTKEEEDLVLGVYSIEMNQLHSGARNGHQEKRVSWWPQAGAFFSSGLSVGWWTPDCERWFQDILLEMEQNRAVLLNNTRWKDRIRGYSAAWRLSKNLDAVHADFLADIG
ncbi:unnamed protein product [Mycena citricolor]|uniref:Uncharacterized protein n=1 Tax=Mycena citricolor TaxID=2018698 RepID=A0AAD2GXX8_9AGAR|nr:unnamed protein product [Mycena citricolor]